MFQEKNMFMLAFMYESISNDWNEKILILTETGSGGPRPPEAKAL